MLDAAPLLHAVDRLADRLRALPQGRLLGDVPGFGSRADAALALARGLADAAQRLEAPDREPVPLPDAGPFAVGDQVAVAGHDLAAAIAAPAGEWARVAAREVLEEALRNVEVTARLMDGRAS
ncbi:hypothetical protein [Wenjunlia tyrosinilytica]|uniref:Uncharacterized protein n=1 Tax=Wenjunlia tyrosinilytica TaxID=1544741 RepID=A0A918DYJ4_9ACTN|nr:hypothetical protein [Wenjunlia tyrosinilytica]GGO88229.1 hypothetical protein GCM10012280_28550 [Wenjunlia tyrosinilytica]